MNFIALKPCCFAGKTFKIGETIPCELVLPEMQRRLLAMGRLAELPDETSKPSSKLQKNKKQAVMKDAELDL